jgi:hypothetical protein
VSALHLQPDIRIGIGADIAAVVVNVEGRIGRMLAVLSPLCASAGDPTAAANAAAAMSILTFMSCLLADWSAPSARGKRTAQDDVSQDWI